MKCDGPFIAKVEKALKEMGEPRDVLPAVMYILLSNCMKPEQYEKMRRIMQEMWQKMHDSAEDP